MLRSFDAVTEVIMEFRLLIKLWMCGQCRLLVLTFYVISVETFAAFTVHVLVNKVLLTPDCAPVEYCSCLDSIYNWQT